MPAVPRGGAGCAGEVIPLAHAFQTLTGAGLVLRPDGSAQEAAAALAERGALPYRLKAKEGIALLAGSPLATALALARLRSAERLAAQLLASAAAAIDALAAPLDPYDEAVGRLAGDPLLEEVLADLRRATGGLEAGRRGLGHPRRGRRAGGPGRRGPQAPVSFRVAPQVLAQLRRTLGRLDEDVRRALVAVTDSPAVVDGRVVAGGGFHAVGLAAGMDAAALSLVQAAELAGQRLHRLLDSRFSGLPDQLSPDPGPVTGLVVVHKRAVGALHEARRLAVPASAGQADTSLGQEDAASFAPEAAEQLRRVEQLTREVVACELLAARQAWWLRRDVAGGRAGAACGLPAGTGRARCTGPAPRPRPGPGGRGRWSATSCPCRRPWGGTTSRSVGEGSGNARALADATLTAMRAVAETYLDAASTTPLHPLARAALVEALDEFGDPARLYGRARRARLRLDRSREQLAAALGAAPDELIFTSGGTEAANLAVTGLARAARRRRHLVVSAVEHTSVLAPARALAAQGFELTEVGVDHAGRVDPEELAAAVRDDTLLVCLQHANHEVGTVQPVREAADLAHERGALLLVDACQTVGRLPVDLADLGADLLVGSGHKVYGPPGTGFLVASRRARLRPVLVGDERERRRRAGMENLPGVAAMAAAVLARVAEAPAEHDRLAGLSDRLLAGLATIPEVIVHGDPARRLPHLVAFSVLYIEGEALLLLLDAKGIAVHSGSSCTADTQEPSHVLAAMGAITHGSVRVSFLHDATEADVDRLLEVLPAAVADLREMTELDTQAIERATEGR